MLFPSTNRHRFLLAVLGLGLACLPMAARAEAPSASGAFNQVPFNPELSVLADISFAGANRKDATAEALGIPGLLDRTAREGKRQGINFNGLELALGASVDPYFDFFGVLAFAPDEVGVEEAYVDTRQLPFGFQVRLGQFLSSFGRQNGLHRHAWDFADPPLVYEAFVGGEGLKNPGLRLSWTAPVDFLLQLNAEVFQGVFDESPTFDAVGYRLTAVDGTPLSSEAPFVPGLFAGSLKTSFDVGDHVFLLGASMLYGHSTQARVEGLPTDQAFFAPGTVLLCGELTYKLLLSSYRSLAWQSEYLLRLSSGDLATAADGRVHSARKRQGGLYSQLVWRFDPQGQWRVGARVDLLAGNAVAIDGAGQPLADLLQRYAAMLEYSPTEFARFRLQYAFDRSRYLAGVQTDVHEALLQVIVAVGPHGAHAF